MGEVIELRPSKPQPAPKRKRAKRQPAAFKDDRALPKGTDRVDIDKWMDFLPPGLVIDTEPCILFCKLRNAFLPAFADLDGTLLGEGILFLLAWANLRMERDRKL